MALKKRAKSKQNGTGPAAEWARLLGSWPDRKGPLHRRLSSAILNALERGLLAAGTRLPSERNLADALGVSRNTVVAAYNALRDENLLESRTGGGTWIRADSTRRLEAREEGPIEKLATHNLLSIMDREGDPAIDFATGTPFPLAGLPEEVLRLPKSEHERLMRTRIYYPFGFPVLREAVAAHYRSMRLPTSPDEILVTTGAQQAIMLAACLFLERGDTALVEDPCYFGALSAFRAREARIESMPVGPRGVEPAVFRNAVAASNPRLAYFTPTFQNPTGAVIPARSRQEIVAMATERNVAIIDDTTIGGIELEAEFAQPPPLAEYDRQGVVITIGSTGKMAWAALRVGWIRAPRHLIERLVRLKTACDLATPLMTQAIAARVLALYGEAQAMRRAELSPKRDLLASILRKRLPAWQFDFPRGGLFLWVRLPHGDARELAQVALRHNLVLLPGSNMSAAQRCTEYLRIPFLLEKTELREGMDRMIRAWEEYTQISRRRPVVQAMT